jgi:hypothetical protein
MARNKGVQILTQDQRERVKKVLLNEIAGMTEQYPQVKYMLEDKGLNIEMGLSVMDMFLSKALKKV